MEYDIEQDTAVLFCRIFFHYLGSVQMPHTWKQGPSLSCINTCIQRIESEGRDPTSVSLEIHNNSLKLVNNAGITIRVFPFHTLVYTGASTTNRECMVVVTRSSISDYSPQLFGGGKMVNISHAFRIQPNESLVKYHGPAKTQKLMRNLAVSEYPQDALRVLKTIVRIFELCAKYEPHMKHPKAHFDNATGRVVLVDFRNNMSDVQSCTSSEHSAFITISHQHTSSDGSFTDNVSYTTSDHSNKLSNPYENITTSYSDTKLNGKISSKSSTSLDCISKHSTFAPKSGSYSSLHESSVYAHSPRKGVLKPQSKSFSESEPCLGNNLRHVEKWLESLDNLLSDPEGVDLFKQFLKTQVSAENLEFWLAVEKYKSLKNPIEIGLQKTAIFQIFINENAPSQVNLEERLRRDIIANMKLPDTSIFNQAQRKAYHILRYDCYPRFKSCTILADYIQGNRLASMKNSLPPEEQFSNQKLKSSHSGIQISSQSIESEKTHKLNKPLSFLRRSFAKRHNSNSKDNTPPLSAQSSSDEFTFVRENHTDENSVFVHIPGRDKLCCKLDNSQTLREALQPLFQGLHLSPELYEFRQADTLNLIELSQNSALFNGKNILLQQHTESFTLILKLPSQPVQEFVLRTSHDKTILDSIQPILDVKNIPKDSISLQLTDCKVPLLLDLGSSVLNKQRVELTPFESEPVRVKNSRSSNSLNNSPSREPKQELLKTQYPNRKVNKSRTSQRTKKDKSIKTKDMFSLLESAQMNRMNDQRSTLERNLSIQLLAEKTPKMPANSEQTDICPHTGETLFQAPTEEQLSKANTHLNNNPVNPRKEYIDLNPPKFTPHKPTIKVPQNLAESKFQPTYFAQNPQLNSQRYNVALGAQQQHQQYKEMYNKPFQHQNSTQPNLPVTSIHQANVGHQSIFYKGVQHLSVQNSPRLYNEQNSRGQYYRPSEASHNFQTTPSPFDECNLPSRMKFSQNPLPNFQPQNLASGAYKPAISKPDPKLTHTYSKPLHTPSYL